MNRRSGSLNRVSERVHRSHGIGPFIRTPDTSRRGANTARDRNRETRLSFARRKTNGGEGGSRRADEDTSFAAYAAFSSRSRRPEERKRDTLAPYTYATSVCSARRTPCFSSRLVLRPPSSSPFPHNLRLLCLSLTLATSSRSLVRDLSRFRSLPAGQAIQPLPLSSLLSCLCLLLVRSRHS